MDAITLSLQVAVSAGRYRAGRVADLLRPAASDRALATQSRRSAESSGRGIDVDAVRSDRAQHATGRGGADAELQQSRRQRSRPMTRSETSSTMLTGIEMPIIEDDIYGDLHYGSVAAELDARFRRSRAGDLVRLGIEDDRAWLSHRLGREPAVSSRISPARSSSPRSPARRCSSSCSRATTQAAATIGTCAACGPRSRRTAQHFIDAIARYFPHGTRVARPAGGRRPLG